MTEQDMMTRRAAGKILFLAVSLSLFIAGFGLAAEDAQGKSVVARVNGSDLTNDQLEEIINEMIPRAFFHGNVTQDKRSEYRVKALEELIKRELYYQESKKTGIAVSAEDIDKALKEIEERFKTRGGLEKVLKANGITMDVLLSRIERNMIISRFDEREIQAKARVSDEFLRDYFDKHKSEYLRPEAARLRMISIHVDPAATKEEREQRKVHAQEVLAKARAGEDFAGLASRYSNDDWRVKGGDFGVRHRGQLDPAIEGAVFSMKAGEISDLVETIYGYHIVKVEERLPQTQMTYDEMKDKLRKKLEDDRKKELQDALLKTLKEKAKIEVLPAAPPGPAEGGQPRP